MTVVSFPYIIAFWAILLNVFWLTETGSVLLIVTASWDIVERVLFAMMTLDVLTLSPYVQFEIVLFNTFTPVEEAISIQIPRVLETVLLISEISLEVETTIELPVADWVRFTPSTVIEEEFVISILSILGLLPGPQRDPYLLMSIGVPIHPFVLLSMSVSFHTPLHCRDTVSPDKRVVTFTFARVCHAVAAESPSFVSLHAISST
jgi:hypothetical protein